MSNDVGERFGNLEWCLRDWHREQSDVLCRTVEVLFDPLSTKCRAKAVKKDLSIPSTGEKLDFVDPLGVAVSETTNDHIKTKDEEKLLHKKERGESVLTNTLAADSPEYFVNETQLPGFTPWLMKRKTILETFETSEKLSITNSFLPNGIPFETQVSTLDRLTQRIQQFDDRTGQKHYANLSQMEYVRVMNELRVKLLLSWSEGRRLESLEIAVELANILSATSSPSFYPSQFVLVTDILDIFGKLVYDRLLTMVNTKRKVEGYGEALMDDFSVDQIPIGVQTVARNWFCKLAVIKELLPRFYVESALIGCMRFLDPDAISVNLMRLCEMPNHMKHWLTSTYARAYICRVIMRLKPVCRELLHKCVNDWIFLSSTVPQTELLTPALEWMIQCASYDAVLYDDMRPLWDFCSHSEKRVMLLGPFISSAPNSYICEHANQFFKLVLQDKVNFSKELTLLGKRLIDGRTDESVRELIMEEVLGAIFKIENISDFVKCAVVWSSFAARYFPLKTVDGILSGLVRKLSGNKHCELFNQDLAELVENLVGSGKTVVELLSTDNFIKLQDFIVDPEKVSSCSQHILSAFVTQRPMSSCDNFCIAYQILTLCTKLLDSLQIDAEEDEEVNDTVDLIKRSLNRFSLDREPERALNFYVDIRAALSTNVTMTVYVICRICNLGYNLIQLGSISHTGSSFLRACIANAFITIASVGDPKQRFHLYIHCALLGLMANSLPQVDATTKCCVELLAHCPEIAAVDYRLMASTFLAFLIMVPDILKKRPLYVFDAFLSAISRYEWHENWLEYGRLLMQCLNYLSVMRLAVYPYHIENVESNDRIYGTSDEFVAVIAEKESLVIARLTETLSVAGSQLPQLSMEMLEMIVSIGAVEAMVAVIYQLWQNVISQKNFSYRRNTVYKTLEAQLSDSRTSKQLLKAINALERNSTTEQ